MFTIESKCPSFDNFRSDRSCLSGPYPLDLAFPDSTGFALLIRLESSGSQKG